VKNIKAIAIVVVMCSISSVPVFAQATSSAKPPQPTETPTIASVLNRQLNSIERNIMGAAEAMPEDKYDFSPATANIPGDFKTPEPVRTVSQQFKHIGDALELYGSAILGQKAAGTPGENGPSNVKTKQEVIAFLKAEFAKAHAAIDTITQQNLLEQIAAPFGNAKTTRLALAVGMVGHSNNHYGQIIEYLRMNGMVPPESQPRK